MFSGVWRLVKEDIWTALGPILFNFGYLVIVFPVMWIWMIMMPIVAPAMEEAFPMVMLLTMGFFLLMVLVMLVASVLFFSGYFYSLARVLSGEKTAFDHYRSGIKKFSWRLVGLGLAATGMQLVILIPPMVFGGYSLVWLTGLESFLLIFAAIIGFYLFVFLAMALVCLLLLFALPHLYIQDTGVLEAVTFSVKNWRKAVMPMLGLVVAGLAAMILAFIPFLSMIVTPFFFLAVYVCYDEIFIKQNQEFKIFA